MTQAALDYEAMTDAELAGIASRGDRQAFRLIMQRCNQRLFRISRSVVGSDDEAEDVVQETYLRAYAALKDFRGASSLLTWLTAIALNEARMRLRKRKPLVDLDTMTHASAQIIPLHAGAPVDPEAEAGRAEARHLMESALDHLPADYRTVFMLRDVEGMTEEETAHQLEIPIGTVKTRLHRARRMLRRDLDRTLSSGITGIFPFLGDRCSQITERVLQMLDGTGR